MKTYTLKLRRRFHSLAFLAIAIAFWAGQWSVLANSMPFSRIYVFGDSLSDNGNFYSFTHLPPAPYVGGRFSNGPVWAEYLADDLGMTGFEQDYATAGSTTGTDNYRVPALGGVANQIQAYLQSHQADRDALYIVWAGANDFFVGLEAGTSAQALIGNGVGNTIQNVGTLWNAGARHILVLNVPDLGKTPWGLSTGAGPQLTALVSAYNQVLGGALGQLESQGVPTITVDAFGVLNTVIANPARYGFVNVIDQGIMSADASNYLFWDSVHPTTRGHQVFEQIAVESLVDYFSPAQGKGTPPAQVHSLNGLVRAAGRP